MTTGGFKMIAVAIIVFILGLTMITTMVTGTDTGSTLVKTLGPIALGAAVLMAIIGLFGGSFGKKG